MLLCKHSAVLELLPGDHTYYGRRTYCVQTVSPSDPVTVIAVFDWTVELGSRFTDGVMVMVGFTG